MKKILCVAFVLLAAIGVFAQERTIEKSEFDAVMRTSLKKYLGQSYRQTENFQDFATTTKQENITSKSVMEFAPQASRSIFEFNSPSLKKKTETIRIDGKTYTRIDNGKWTEEQSKPFPKNYGKLKTIEEQTEYKSLAAEKLDGQTANVYAKIERKKLVDESNKKEMFSTLMIKYWFGADGRIIKQEMQSEKRMKSEKNTAESVFRNLRVTVWEIDPNIKIEAPIAANNL